MASTADDGGAAEVPPVGKGTSGGAGAVRGPTDGEGWPTGGRGGTTGAGRAARSAVLRGFFDLDGRLVQWPAKLSRRLLALDELAQLFEPGLRYTETEVNATLRAAVAGRVDVVTARRYLVDAEMLLRESGVYWRAGGTVAL